jgi:hypothetical protein
MSEADKARGAEMSSRADRSMTLCETDNLREHAKAMLRSDATTSWTRLRGLDSERWSELLDRLDADAGVIHDRYATRAVADLASYANLTIEEHRNVALENADFLVARLRETRTPRIDEDGAVYREAGVMRAEQGVPIGHTLQAWHLYLEVFLDRARELLDDRGDDPTFLALVELTMAWAHFGMATMAQGHEAAQASLLRHAQHRLTSLIRGVLFGELTPAEIHTAALAQGIDTAAPHHAIRAQLTDSIQVADIERYLQTPGTPDSRNALIGLIDGDVCGIVRTIPEEPAPTRIGVSRAVSLREMESAFREATRVAQTAAAFARPGVQTLASLGVRSAIVGDDEVGDALVRRYVEPLDALGAMRDGMLDTIEQYFRCQSRLEPAARALHVHVNTVKYRLARFEELTGATLREPEVLLEAWWAVQRWRLA